MRISQYATNDISRRRISPLKTAARGRLSAGERQRKTRHVPLRVAVVDDHRFMRELISRELARQNGRYEVVADYASAEDAVVGCTRVAVDVLIVDVHLPGLNGIDAIPHLKEVAPAARILLCTAHAADERLLDALRCGADGFVEKTNSFDDFLEAVERVSEGGHYFCTQSRIARMRTQPTPEGKPDLTSRQAEVTKLIAQGYSTKQIADRLGVSQDTVESHRRDIMRKLKVRNVAELVGYAFRSGLVK